MKSCQLPAGFGGYGDASYIDSVILRDRDNDDATTTDPVAGWRAAADSTLDERIFYCQNWRADVVALTKADGTPMEYVRYSSYGEPTSMPVADLNADGLVDMTDATLWQDLEGGGGGADSAYGADLDFNGAFPHDGDRDLFLESHARTVGHSSMDAGPSSTWLGNRKGYAGYEYDTTIRSYHVRHRVLVPELGRWNRRDPLGYVDGASLFEYVQSKVIAARDAMGLCSDVDSNSETPEQSMLVCFFYHCDNKDCGECFKELAKSSIPLLGKLQSVKNFYRCFKLLREKDLMDCFKCFLGDAGACVQCYGKHRKDRKRLEDKDISPADLYRESMLILHERLENIFPLLRCMKCFQCIYNNCI